MKFFLPIRLLNFVIIAFILANFGSFSFSEKRNELRSKLKINQCHATKVISSDTWPLLVNGHCGTSVKAYEVINAHLKEVNGLYEYYGRFENAAKYEKVLNNGTAFKIQRHRRDEDEDNFVWVIIRADLTVLYVALVDSKTPPLTGWTSVDNNDKSFKNISPPYLIRHKIKKVANEIINFEPTTTETELNINGDQDMNLNNEIRFDTDEELLNTMLHPMIGRRLGTELHHLYINAAPVPAIVIDRVFNNKLLSKSLAYENIPLSQWVGPEQNVHCCAHKYRLDFDAWRTNKWARALQSILSHRTFIQFLEALTGIIELLPIKYSDPNFLQLGSSMIAIARGGYLHVHNDVSCLLYK